MFPNNVFADAETQITNNIEQQTFPDIDGNRIVWTDSRNGNRDIYMYDLSTNTETQITTDSSDQSSPKISGSKIVWQDNRFSPSRIYMFDTMTQIETSITNHSSGSYNPDIDGNIIVWEDGRNDYTEIYSYDLATNTEKRITNAAFYQNSPDVSGSKIVWQDNRCGVFCKPDIYMYDLLTNIESQITSNQDAQENPAISGEKIVWQDKRNGGQYDVYLYDLATNNETRLTTNSSDQLTVGISGNRITWNDYRNLPSVYLYNINDQVEINLTNLSTNHYNPSISGDKIVWQDFRNGNSDIYMYKIELEPENQVPIASIYSNPVFILGQQATFSGSESTDSDGTIIDYLWDFGDGSTGGGVNATHIYTMAGTYQVTLTVTDDDGATASVTASVRVNSPPVASIAPIDRMNIGQNIIFDSSESSDVDGLITSHTWDFGDGTSGDGVTVNHSYAQSGTHQVILIVTDSDGATAITTSVVTVNTPPVAAVEPVSDVTIGEASNFDAAGSTDSDGTLVSYSWDFGDGSTNSGQGISHTYDAVGTYQVTLVVTDSDGATSTAIAQAIVIAEIPIEEIENLIVTVEDMNLGNILTNLLTNRLERAITALENGREAQAINRLESFINAVRVARLTGQVTPVQAQQLIDEANRIIDIL